MVPGAASFSKEVLSMKGRVAVTDGEIERAIRKTGLRPSARDISVVRSLLTVISPVDSRFHQICFLAKACWMLRNPPPPEPARSFDDLDDVTDEELRAIMSGN